MSTKCCECDTELLDGVNMFSDIAWRAASKTGTCERCVDENEMFEDDFVDKELT